MEGPTVLRKTSRYDYDALVVVALVQCRCISQLLLVTGYRRCCTLLDALRSFMP